MVIVRFGPFMLVGARSFGRIAAMRLTAARSPYLPVQLVLNATARPHPICRSTRPKVSFSSSLLENLVDFFCVVALIAISAMFSRSLSFAMRWTRMISGRVWLVRSEVSLRLQWSVLMSISSNHIVVSSFVRRSM